jgi:hypothetical protein
MKNLKEYITEFFSTLKEKSDADARRWKNIPSHMFLKNDGWSHYCFDGGVEYEKMVGKKRAVVTIGANNKDCGATAIIVKLSDSLPITDKNTKIEKYSILKDYDKVWSIIEKFFK